MLFLCLLFLLVNMQFLDAAQQSQLWKQKIEESSIDVAQVMKKAIDTGDVKTFKKILYAGADSEQKIKMDDDTDTTELEEMVSLHCLLWRLEHSTEKATQEDTCQMIEEALYYGARTDIKVLHWDGHEETLDSLLQQRMCSSTVDGGSVGDSYLCKAVWNVERRNKELAVQAEKIIAPEFLLLDLAKIVSGYIAAPIGKS